MNEYKLILATASYCGPCRVLKTRIEKEGLLEKIEIVGMEDNIELFRKYNIKSVPKLIAINEDGTHEIFSGSDDIIDKIKQ